MLIFPAIDIKDGYCVRLYKGDFSTVHQVAESPLDTACSFRNAGAEWVHMVDLDGAKTGKRINSEIFLEIAKKSGLKVQLGGGIRDMETLEFYLSGGISRCILGSAALKNPQFVRQSVEKYGEKIAVGIDAVNSRVAAEGWLEVSDISYIQMAKQMEEIGVETLIYTDISKDGTLEGPNFNQLSQLSKSVSCNIIASGGIKDIKHIRELADNGLFGAICGKSLYSGTLELSSAIIAADLERLFQKSDLIPAIVQEDRSGKVLMLAYMSLDSLRRTIETETTWFWSRSRNELWNKGSTSGHFQHVLSITADCDNDTLLIKVEQIGAACHTGAHSCFFKEIL